MCKQCNSQEESGKREIFVSKERLMDILTKYYPAKFDSKNMLSGTLEIPEPILKFLLRDLTIKINNIQIDLDKAKSIWNSFPSHLIENDESMKVMDFELYLYQCLGAYTMLSNYWEDIQMKEASNNLPKFKVSKTPIKKSPAKKTGKAKK